MGQEFPDLRLVWIRWRIAYVIWMPEGQRRPTTSQMTVISIDLYLLVINSLIKEILVLNVQSWVIYKVVNSVYVKSLIDVCEC